MVMVQFYWGIMMRELLDWIKLPFLILLFFAALRIMMWAYLQLIASFDVTGW